MRNRIIAQVMSIGTDDDIRRLERAQPGWISERSWEFWRGRLRAAGPIPEKPPRRSFYEAAV